MSGPCFAHFQMNCKICFPTVTSAAPATTTVSPGGGGAATPANSTPGTVETSPVDVPGTPTEAPSADKKKRKRIAVEFRPLKRKKNAVIDCVIAQQILRRDLGLTNKFFKSGTVLAWALEPDDPAFRYIHDYVACGQEHGFGLKVCSILRIVAKAKSLEDAPMDFKDDPETKDKLRMMLWHGTRKTAIASILENGLVLPRHRYQMFGPGIYFADRISKCCQYSGVNFPPAKAFFFLCDVLVGNIYESKQAMKELTSPPRSTIGTGTAQRIVQHDSVQGIGRNIPNAQGNKVLDGSVWPLGETVQRADNNGSIVLNFNEYIVYNENQVQPKYLVKVEFMQEPFYEKF